MASPVPIRSKPFQVQDPGTAPPWLRTSQTPAMPSATSDPASIFGKTAPTQGGGNSMAKSMPGLAGLGQASQQGGGWDGFSALDLKGASGRQRVNLDPSRFADGSDTWRARVAHLGPMAGWDKNMQLYFEDDAGNRFGGGAVGNMNGFDLSKIDPKKPLYLGWENAGQNGFRLEGLTKNSSVYGGKVPNAFDMSSVYGGTNVSKELPTRIEPSTGPDWRAESAAKWDAGAQERWNAGQAVNEGYSGAAMNPNTPGGLSVNGAARPSGPPAMPNQHMIGSGADIDPSVTAAISGNPAARGGGPPVVPGGNSGGFLGGARPGSPPANPGSPPGTAAPARPGDGATAPPGDTWDANLGLDGLPAIDTDFTGAARAGADAAYRGATQFMDEDFKRERQSNEARLLSQGLQPGSEAYETAMARMERGQNATRQNAAYQAQGVGHQQAGDLLLRALQARQQGVNERFGTTDRRLTGRAQDITRDSTGLNASLANRRLNLDEDGQSFQQLAQLIALSRAGVNMPNFGAPGSLDVGNAFGIAQNAENAAAGRNSANRSMWANVLAMLGSKYL